MMSSCNNSTLIGVLDGVICESHQIDWSVNKIGGKPAFFPDESPTEYKFSCKNCDNLLALVSQICCPLDGSKYHRILLIYACISPSCWNKSNSWYAIRKQYFANDVAPCESIGDESVSKEMWLDNEDNWGEEEEYREHDQKQASGSSPWNSIVAECSLETANLSLNEPVVDASGDKYGPADQSLEDSLNEELDNDAVVVCGGPLSTSSESRANWLSKPEDVPSLNRNFRPMFKEYFVSVVAEPHTDDSVETKHLENLVRKYRDNEDSTSTKPSNEDYEKADVKHGDKVFHRFKKKLSLCPNQVIRYCWMGSPLFMTEMEEVNVPECKCCGAKRIYEMQLMSPLVNFLQLTNIDMDALPLEFGIAVVYSCENSCWNDGDAYREEHIVIQADPDEALFKSLMK